MTSVKADQQIVAFTDDDMRLFVNATGQQIVTATRNLGGEWTIKGGDLPDIKSETRVQAISAMCERALAMQPGTGYSTMVPTGLPETP